MPKTATFYRYEDASGRVHLVDSLEAVPKPLRGRATQLEMPGEHDGPSLGDKVNDAASTLSDYAELQVYKATEITHGAANRTALGGWLNLPAVGGTAGALLGGAVVFMVWRRKAPRWLRLVLAFVAVGLFGGAYLGWVRRQAGLSGDALTSPTQIIEDARRTVEQANERQRESERSLRDP